MTTSTTEIGSRGVAVGQERMETDFFQYDDTMDDAEISDIMSSASKALGQERMKRAFCPSDDKMDGAKQPAGIKAAFGEIAIVPVNPKRIVSPLSLEEESRKREREEMGDDEVCLYEERRKEGLSADWGNRQQKLEGSFPDIAPGVQPLVLEGKRESQSPSPMTGILPSSYLIMKV